MLFQVALPNGRKLDLDSKKGADEFVDTFGTAFISTSLTTTDDKELESAYMLMYLVADNASPEKIASGIPESELCTLVAHSRDTFNTLSTDSKWLRSGTVSMCHELLFKAIASFSKYPSFVKIFLSNESMEAVAKFYASRKKNDTPNISVAEFILRLVNNILFDFAQVDIRNEKGFSTIEKTGLLGQFIRCVPVDPGFSAAIMTCLQTCLQLVKKKLKSGTPTGDILDDVIAGRDGPINEKAKSSLARLQTLARLSNGGDEFDDVSIKRCRNCKKTETQMDGTLLMKCQGCKVTCYGSKDCQVTDWKSHKNMCKAISSGIVHRSAVKTFRTTMWAFVDSNFFDIAKEVYKNTQEFNDPKKELLVEIDFFGDFSGDAPALRNEFKVWLTSGFFGGSSVVDAPDLFRTHAKKGTLARFLREENEEVTSDDLLAVCRAGNGMVSFSRLNCPGAETGYPRFSDEVVESIGSEDYDRMVAYLGKETTDEYFREKRGGLT
jgi:hypothetical protein